MSIVFYSKRRSRQSGVVLVIALIVLVAMTLAGIALMRSVDTSNLIAGNLAFQQAATNSADIGVEEAISRLKSAADLGSDEPSMAYAAYGSEDGDSPTAEETWDAYWNRKLKAREVALPTDPNTGNRVSYVIDRLCKPNGAIASCVASPTVTAATGNAEEGGEVQLAASAVVYYRITVRVAGPKNTVSYVQTIVSL